MTTTAKDTRKFKELVLYVATKSEADETFNAAKLNRLLFYIDFLSHLTLADSISKHAYFRGEYGPMPVEFDAIKDEMKSAGQIAIHPDDYPGHAHGRVFALQAPEIASFTAREIDLIDRCLDRFWNVPAARLTEISEELADWLSLDVDDEIPYDLVLVHRHR